MKDLFHLENAPKKDRLNETYDQIRINDPHIKDKINAAFDFCSDYLDENYQVEFPKKDKFFSKLWELWVCSRILKSPLKEKLLPNSCKNKDGGGPDFIIQKAIEDHDLVLECVCPTYGESKVIDSGQFHLTKESSKNRMSTNYSGYDEFIVSRYMSSLHDKAKKASKYQETNPDSYYVLCVSGEILSRWKGKKYLSHPMFTSLPTEDEFIAALMGKRQEWLARTTSTISLEFEPVCIEKTKETVLSTFDDHYMKSLKNFHGFVLCDHSFFPLSQVKHQVYKASPEIKEILIEIFNRKNS